MALSLALGTLIGCSQERRLEPEFEAHPPEWNVVTSADFHGARVLARSAAGCRSCHGADLDGSRTVPGCYECHDGAGGHPRGFLSEAGDAFHGDDVAASGPQPCSSCHGGDFHGGWSRVSCYSCHAGGPSGHPDGWLNPISASFHGRRVIQEGLGDCRRCHGFGLGGGTSGVACSDCHG